MFVSKKFRGNELVNWWKAGIPLKPALNCCCIAAAAAAIAVADDCCCDCKFKSALVKESFTVLGEQSELDEPLPFKAKTVGWNCCEINCWFEFTPLLCICVVVWVNPFELIKLGKLLVKTLFIVWCWLWNAAVATTSWAAALTAALGTFISWLCGRSLVSYKKKILSF